ncbi:unnamed protein product [Laminaria digitata]
MLPDKRQEKCLAPKSWVIFLRTHKRHFSSIGEASLHYVKFKTNVVKKLVGIAGNNLTTKQTKAEYKKHICAYFYNHMDKAGKNTRENKKKMSNDVDIFSKKNSIHQTLESMGAARESADIVTKEKPCGRLAKLLNSRKRYERRRSARRWP